jgi:hypothetical protein
MRYVKLKAEEAEALEKLLQEQYGQHSEET